MVFSSAVEYNLITVWSLIVLDAAYFKEAQVLSQSKTHIAQSDWF